MRMDALLEAIVQKGPPGFIEPRQWSVELRDFVAVMLQKQPEARHDAARCLGHVFLSRGAAERGDTRRVLCRRCAALPKDAVPQPSTKPEVPDDFPEFSATADAAGGTGGGGSGGGAGGGAGTGTEAVDPSLLNSAADAYAAIARQEQQAAAGGGGAGGMGEALLPQPRRSSCPCTIL